MAYVVDTTNTISISNKQIGLGVRLSNNVTCFDTIYDIAEQAKENLKSLLLTRVGERYMLPNFGTELLSILFEPSVDLLNLDIQEILTPNISYWLPYIEVDSIDVKSAQSNADLNNEIEILILYSVLNSTFKTESLTLAINSDGVLTIE